VEAFWKHQSATGGHRRAGGPVRHRGRRARSGQTAVGGDSPLTPPEREAAGSNPAGRVVNRVLAEPRQCPTNPHGRGVSGGSRVDTVGHPSEDLQSRSGPVRTRIQSRFSLVRQSWARCPLRTRGCAPQAVPPCAWCGRSTGRVPIEPTRAQRFRTRMTMVARLEITAPAASACRVRPARIQSDADEEREGAWSCPSSSLCSRRAITKPK
jgi:hypothetical protein